MPFSCATLKHPVVAAAVIALLLVQPAFQVAPAAQVSAPLRVDLAWQNASGALSLWEMNDVIRRAEVALDPGQITDADWKIVGAGDFNSDGQTDLMWHHQTNGGLVVWYMSGSKLLANASLVPDAVADTNWKVRTVGDLNNDGKPDLIWQHVVDGRVAAWFMNGIVLVDGVTLSQPVADLNWHVVGTGDTNGDGKTDLIWNHRADGRLASWRMDGSQLLAGVLLSPEAVSDPNWQVKTVGRMDGDSWVDLVWQHKTTNQVAIWHMNGETLYSGELMTPSTNTAGWQIATTFPSLQVGTPTLSAEGGTYNAELSITAATHTPGATVRYTTDGSQPTEASPVFPASLSVTQSTTVTVKGFKSGFVTSRTASASYTLQAATPSISHATGTYSDLSVTLSTATPNAQIRYTLDGTEPSEGSALYTGPVAIAATNTTLRARTFRTGWTPSNSAAATYTLQAAAPSFQPAAGTYVGPFQVAMQTSTPQAVIRWTGDGSEPNETSPAYSGPINVAAGTSIALKARAFRANWISSSITTGSYTASWTGVTPTPVAAPTAGTYSAGSAVRIAVSDLLATIYYTLDGSVPTTSSQVYVAYTPLVFQTTTTVKARAFREPESGLAPSEILTAVYQMGPAPQLLVNGATPPQTPCVSAASAVTVGVSNGLGNIGDWVGLYPMGGPDNEYVDWLYLSGTQDYPASPITDAAVSFTAPATPGEYEVRLCRDDSYQCSGINATFMVAESGRCVSIGFPHPHTTFTERPVISLQAKAAKIGGSIAAVRFYNGSTLLGTSISSPYHVVWGPPPGVHTVTAVAEDDGGGTVTSSELVFNVADTQLTVNGAASPAVITVNSGAALSAVTSQGIPFPLDTRMGLYGVDRGNGEPLHWQYLNGTQVMPTSAVMSATLNFVAPDSAGVYELRLCTKEGYDCFATSASIEVRASLIGTGTGTTLNTPISWPSSGDIHGPAQMITVYAAPGVTVRYTLDGSTPNETSPVYGGPFQITHSTSLRARAYKTGWSPSAVLVADYRIDNTLPFITAAFSPPANAAGWHNVVPVTASFTCSDDQTGIGICPSSVVFSVDTAGESATVRARDRAGNWAPLTITARIDRVPPSVSISNPLPGSLIRTDSVLIQGVASDVLSGIDRVLCDMTVATRSGASFQCNVPVSAAPNQEVTVRAWDVAGNSSLATVEINTPRIISLTPTWGPVGTSVVVTGVNFGAVQGSSTVTFNGMAATPVSWSDTSISVTVTATSTGPAIVTVGARASNAVTFTVTTGEPPTITASVSPTAPANGWYNQPATVSFACSSSWTTIASCPSPVVVQSDGQGIDVTGEAVDAVGNRGAVSLLLNVDRTPPVITLHTPADGDVLLPGTATVELRGNAVDFTSGIASVTCNGVAGVVSGQRYTCTVPVGAGGNAIHILAQDNAANTAERDLTVTVGPPAAPITLELSPARMTLLPGESRQLRASDERGRAVTGGTFSVTNPLVVAVDIVDNVPVVRALSGGETTITLTRDQLSAQATVTVLPQGTLEIPNGTTLWQLADRGTTAPMRGRVLPAFPAATPDGAESADLFYTEYEFQDLKRVRAATLDGRELWTYSVNDKVRHVAADNHGGLVLVMGGELPGWGFHESQQSIRRLDGRTGAVTWEYIADLVDLSEVAIHPDGTVYFVESKEKATTLIALNGETGDTRVRIMLNAPGREIVNATAPLVRDDKTIVVLAHRWHLLQNYEQPETVLVTVNPETLTKNEQQIEGINARYSELNRLIPDPAGGLLVSFADKGIVARLGSDNVLMPGTLDLRLDPFNQFPMLAPQFVMGADAAYALVQTWPGEPWQQPAKLVKFDPVTLAVLSTTFVGESPNYLLHSAIQDGGAAVTGAEWGHNQEVAPGLWAGWTPSPVLLADVARGVPDTASPYWQGNAQAARAPQWPRITIFVEPSTLAQGPPLQTAATYKQQVEYQSWFGNLRANVVFRIEQEATVDNFLGAVNRLTEAVAFIGHSVVVDGVSFGLKFRDKSLVKRTTPQIVGPGGASATVITDQIQSRARVIFIASCEIGPEFLSLWNINENTSNRALIVPTELNPSVNLFAGSGAWFEIAKALGAGQTVGQAVAAGNAWLASANNPLRFRVVGSSNVKVK